MSLTIVDLKVSVTLQLQELAYQSIAFRETETFLIDKTNNMENMLEQEYMIESYICRSAFLENNKLKRGNNSYPFQTCYLMKFLALL
ncbi:MAG: hypothetical protein WA364_27180 [Candidatus Nitrosopolaris sp.]